MSKDITKRDIEYLKTVFKKKGFKTPTGPSKIAEEMDTTRAGAMKKLKKLQEKGLGDYIEKEGLVLNEKGLEKIKEELEKHHLLERFLQRNLNMTHEECCKESEKIASNASEKLLKNLKSNTDFENPCECGYTEEKSMSIEQMKKCHWFKTGGGKN